MAKRQIADKYPNRAFETVTMSAANTLTFSQVQFGVGLFQGVAALIHRIEWFPSAASVRELGAATDSIDLALTNRDDLASLSPINQSVLACKQWIGRGAEVAADINPARSDFSGLIGGGLIIPANPLYVGMDTLGAAAASSCVVVIYMTFRELTDAEYVELVQTIMPANL